MAEIMLILGSQILYYILILKDKLSADRKPRPQTETPAGRWTLKVRDEDLKSTPLL